MLPALIINGAIALGTFPISLKRDLSSLRFCTAVSFFATIYLTVLIAA